MLFQTWASANASSGLPTLLQGLTRQVHGVVPPMWLMLPARPLQWPQQNTWKQKYLQQQLIHLALNSYCLFFFCPLPKCSLFLSQGNYGSPLFLLNITLHAVESSVPVAFLSPLCLLELQHPTAGRASPLVSPVLPFPCGNGLFLLLPP